MKIFKTLFLMATILSFTGCGGDNGSEPENARPQITSPASATVAEDTPFTYTVAFTDPDGPDTAITFANYPSWLTVANAVISGHTPWGAADASFLAIVSDGSLADTLGVSVTVEQPDDFYLTFLPRFPTLPIGDSVTLTVIINSVENLYAVAFNLIYDTSYIKDSVTIIIPDQSLFGTDSLFYFSNSIPGGVGVGVGKLQGANVSGSGPLIEITFTSVGSSSGTVDIEFQNVTILDNDGTENPDIDNLVLRSATIFHQ